MSNKVIYVEAEPNWFDALVMAVRIHEGLEELRKIYAEAMEEQDEICINPSR